MASREEQSRRVPCTRLAVAAAVSAAVIDTSGKQKIAGNTPATTACALGHGLIKFARTAVVRFRQAAFSQSYGVPWLQPDESTAPKFFARRGG
ncbi:MAG: hypothetical protein DME85_04305 [Verrucomicrobia bacterium]|nr:MAG: hypothetical protein DME85_04305 [Verrucomicrobiota bacterium]